MSVGYVPLRLLSCLLIAIPLVPAAAIEVDTTSTTPGGRVTVTGSGFDSCASPDYPNRSVEVYATGPSTDLPAPVEVEPDPAGGFTATLVIPATASPGQYTVGVWCARRTHDGPGITTPLTVTAPAAPVEELRLSPRSVDAGGSVTASGSGFVQCAAGGRVTIQLEDAAGVGTGLTETGVDPSGAFSTQVRIPPETPSGAHDVAARCTADGIGEYAADHLTVTTAPVPPPVTTVPPSVTTVPPSVTTVPPSVTRAPDPVPSPGGGSRDSGFHSEGPDPGSLVVLLGVVAALVGGAVLSRRLLRRRAGGSPPQPAVIHAGARSPEIGPTTLRTGPGTTLAIRVLVRSEPGTARVRRGGEEWTE